MRRAAFALALLTVGLAVLASAATRGDAGRAVTEGGTFRITFAPPEGLDHIDPAISNTQAAWSLLDLACARLMTYPDKPAPAGLTPVPEVAKAEPTVSRDGRTYTFTLRKGFRFSDGTPLQANAFAQAIARVLAPGVRSPGLQYMRDIVGAEEVQAGRASIPSGVDARGMRLSIRLKGRNADFPARTTMPYFCAVPPTLPPDPEGKTTFPGAGPYYVSDYRPGQRVVLERNSYYRGTRPHHFDRFEADLQGTSAQDMLDRIERGQTDWGIGPPPVYFAPDRRLAAKYGVNQSQFFVKKGFTFRGFVLNMSRPLFRNNLRLRQAVNYAIDRPAFARTSGGALSNTVTDQYLPQSLPGFANTRVYPLAGPNLKKARALANGQTRGGKAVLYIYDLPLTLGYAQVLKDNLAKIGLEVDVQPIPQPAYPARVSAREAAFDIAFIVTPSTDYYDPYVYLNSFFDSRFIGSTNWAHLDSPRFDRLLRAAARLRGPARLRAYGKLDSEIARDAAPIAAESYTSEPTLVSARIGCVVLRPALDLAAACLT